MERSDYIIRKYILHYQNDKQINYVFQLYRKNQ
jgi:hypothetical protein